MLQKIIILGTGGTIAGLACDPAQAGQYQAAQLDVGQLLNSLPAGFAVGRLASEQVAQIDSKDMNEEVWRLLLVRLMHHLQDPEVAGIVITHGTDTLEETAFLLSALLNVDKPVILTGAMRPANAFDADGPRNLSDAVLAVDQLGGGVWLVFAGVAHPGCEVRKVHATRLDSFDSASAMPLSYPQLEQKRVGKSPRPEGVWPSVAAVLGSEWPRVEMLMSHAGATDDLLQALLHRAPPGRALKGVVLVGTGNGTIPERWSSALSGLLDQGVSIWISSRCEMGGQQCAIRDGMRVVPWTPQQARVGLLLSLII